MRKLVHESEFGTIEYRLPTIPEMTKMLGFLKDFKEGRDEFAAVSWLVENLEPFILQATLNIDGEIVTDWSGMMNYSDLFQDLLAISNSIMEKTFGKNQAKKKR